ncbi:MAG: hypothetical protein KDB00_25940 [Planctomycetales bacterium]|nr:hypothetical protein [Planctomycetales bacterium]
MTRSASVCTKENGGTGKISYYHQHVMQTTNDFWRAILLTVAAIVLLNSEGHGEDGETSRPFLSNGVTAHRGDSAHFPENSLPAFKSGISLGADWIELDLFRTKDGKLVVIHDATTARTGDKDLNVSDCTYDELQAVDIATDFRRRNGKTLAESPALQVPLLEDVLRLIMKQNRTRVSIQPKMNCVKDALLLIESMNAEPWVGFNDGNLQLMIEVKRSAPKVPVFWDRGADTDIDDDIRIATEHHFRSLVIHHSGITPEKIQKIKAAGLEPGAWTVNDRQMMSQMLNLGVERIYTDFPGELLEIKTDR